MLSFSVAGGYMEKKMIYTDVLVIGAGVAGLRAACAAVRQGVKVIIVNKGASASPEIMGFDAVVEKEDTKDCFFEDLRASACNISREELSRTLAECSVNEIDFLESIGFHFDQKPDGEYHVLHTLGCKYPRLVHHKAITGLQAVHLMIDDCRARGVEIHQPVTITDIIRTDAKAVGAVGVNMDSGELTEYISKAVILASGGCGAMQRETTYPKEIVGDGYAIAYRAGADLLDMEFQQFEPCSFIYPEDIKGRVVPTTLLRSGAELRNGLYQEFMTKYGLNRANAKKGELARAMVSEVNAGRGTPHGGIYYDMTMMPREMIVEGHSIFYEPALAAGLDITKEPAEMIPAAHTNLGGVCIDKTGATKIPGLYAAGEVTGGVHGADRIGGSAGAEALVFGNRAGTSAAAYAKDMSFADKESVDTVIIPHELLYATFCERKTGIPVTELRTRIRETLTKNVSIFRNEQKLTAAMKEIMCVEAELETAYADTPEDIVLLYNCYNMVLLAKMQITASLMRKESRGVFFREDFPERDDANWSRNIIFTRGGNEMQIRVAEPI